MPALPSRSRLLLLGVLFAVTTAWTWAAWGHVRVDFGGALHRAERIADGGVLYRDIQVHYPPLAPYTMGGLLALFGKHLDVVYTTGLLLLLVESWLLWQVARRFLDENDTTIGLVAFWLLLAFQPGLFNWIVPNVFAATFASLFATAVVAVLVSDSQRPSALKLAGAGILIAATGLSKFEYGLAAAATAIVYTCAIRPAERTGRLAQCMERFTALLTVGLPATVLAAVTFGLLLLTVPLEVMIDDNLYRERSLTSALASYKKTLFEPLLPEVGKAALCYLLLFPLLAIMARPGLRWLRGNPVEKAGGLFLLLIPIIGAYLASRFVSPDETRNLYKQLQFSWTPTAWLVVALGAAVLRERLANAAAWRTLAIVGVFSFAVALRWDFFVAWPAYYAVFAPFLVVLLSRTMLNRFASGDLETGPALALVFITWIATGAAEHAADYRKHDFSLSYPRGTIWTTPQNGRPMRQTINFLRMNAPPGTPIAVIPEEQLINFLAETPHPTRDTGVGPGWLATREDERRFLEEIRTAGTPFVVLSNRRYTEFQTGGLDSYEPDVVGALYRSYVPAANTRFYRILERRDRALAREQEEVAASGAKGAGQP